MGGDIPITPRDSGDSGSNQQRQIDFGTLAANESTQVSDNTADKNLASIADITGYPSTGIWQPQQPNKNLLAEAAQYLAAPMKESQEYLHKMVA